MKVLALCLAMLISSSVFAQISDCDKLQLSSFNKYLDDRIDYLDKQIQDGSWATSEEYKDYDECRLYGLLDDLKSYSASKKAYYCSKALVFCSPQIDDTKVILKEIYVLDCDKPYVTFDFNNSSCGIFDL